MLVNKTRLLGVVPQLWVLLAVLLRTQKKKGNKSIGLLKAAGSRLASPPKGSFSSASELKLLKLMLMLAGEQLTCDGLIWPG